MKLTLIEGPAVTLVCAGCDVMGVGGTEQYSNASRGEVCNPSYWYQSDGDSSTYCDRCAAKLVEQDQTRSIHQFYADTSGTEIRPENLPEL